MSVGAPWSKCSFVDEHVSLAGPPSLTTYPRVVEIFRKLSFEDAFPVKPGATLRSDARETSLRLWTTRVSNGQLVLFP